MPHCRKAAGTGLALVLSPAPAFAHVPTEGSALGWHDDPYAVLGLAVALLSYLTGTYRAWRRAAPGRGISRGQVAAFLGGWLMLVAALLSPLASLSRGLFSAHMVEHELIIAVAAPLLVLSRPLVAFLWALPRRVRRALTAAPARARIMGAWLVLSGSFAAFLLHALVLWLWHVPAAFEAALAAAPLHAAQHLSFLAAGIVYWWSLLNTGRGEHAGGSAILSLFATSVHSSVLGALMTLSPVPWYVTYATLRATSSLTPIEDQQIAGLVMWVPAGLIYTGAALGLCVRWLREAERRMQKWEHSTGHSAIARRPS